jgi:ABC-type glutathione transport system ATPase component
MDKAGVVHARSGRRIVSQVSFELAPGRCLGIVGESGSGKTLLCRALLGLLPQGLQAEGEIRFEGMDMIHASPEAARRLRGQGMGFILQHPMTAFDPLYTLGSQLAETLQEKLGLSAGDAGAAARQSLSRLGLPERVMASYPHQLSGGQLQRCMIALALALKTRLLVADEPTTALDAQNQLEALTLFRRLKEEAGTTLLFVSHDLGAVQMLADSLLVMRRGLCVEQGEAARVFNEPRHPYTQYLVATRLALTRGFRQALGGRHA